MGSSFLITNYKIGAQIPIAVYPAHFLEKFAALGVFKACMQMTLLALHIAKYKLNGKLVFASGKPTNDSENEKDYS